MIDTTWQVDAACVDVAPAVFFLEANEEEAKTYCAICPVRSECLEYAFANKEYRVGREGIWGGLSPREIRSEWRRRRKDRR